MFLELLPVGERNALPMRQLADLLGADERLVRKHVELARRNGNVICSSDRGYYLPATEVELKDYLRRNHKRIRTAAVCLRKAEALLSDVEAGRIRLGGDDFSISSKEITGDFGGHKKEDEFAGFDDEFAGFEEEFAGFEEEFADFKEEFADFKED